LSLRDEALVQALGISIQRLAEEALGRSRQTVNRGIHGNRDYFKPIDLTKIVRAWRNSDIELYALSKSAICQIYPEFSTAVIDAAEHSNSTAISASTSTELAPVDRESAIDGLLLKEYPDSYRADFSRAINLSVMGTNLRRLIHNMIDIVGVLDRGGTIQVILLDPHSNACKYAAIQDWGRGDDDSLRAYAQTVVHAWDVFSELKAKLPNRENLIIRVIDYPLAFGMDAMEFDDEKHGKIYVRYYPMKTMADDRPIVVLSDSDGYWYKFYKEQFALHWQLATERPFLQNPHSRREQIA
jgi:hypothetical protein